MSSTPPLPLVDLPLDSSFQFEEHILHSPILSFFPTFPQFWMLPLCLLGLTVQHSRLFFIISLLSGHFFLLLLRNLTFPWGFFFPPLSHGGYSPIVLILQSGFSGGSDGKESAYNVGDLGSMPGSGRSPGEGKERYPLQYSRAFLVAQMVVKNLPAMQETWVQSLGWDDPLEKGMATHSSILAWRFHGQRSLAGYSPWGRKESDMTEWLQFLSFFLSCWIFQ